MNPPSEIQVLLDLKNLYNIKIYDIFYDLMQFVALSLKGSGLKFCFICSSEVTFAFLRLKVKSFCSQRSSVRYFCHAWAIVSQSKCIF